MIGMAIGAGIGLLSGIISGGEEQRNREAMRKRLLEARISKGEQRGMQQDIIRAANAGISTSMNQMAFTSRGADASIAQGAMLGQLEGTKLNTLAGLDQRIAFANQGLETQAAGVEDVNIPDLGMASMIEGGIGGYQIESGMKYQDQIDELLDLQTDREPVGDLAAGAAPSTNFAPADQVIPDSMMYRHGDQTATEALPYEAESFGGISEGPLQQWASSRSMPSELERTPQSYNFSGLEGKGGQPWTQFGAVDSASSRRMTSTPSTGNPYPYDFNEYGSKPLFQFNAVHGMNPRPNRLKRYQGGLR